MKLARSRRLNLEQLEDRHLLAIFGVPWVDAQHLTLSFVPDGTPIAGQTSDLFRSFDAEMPTAEWQREILRAVQTWAMQADISVGVVSDGGQPFGTIGPTQSDPRFGDIRIGAQTMSGDALAISIPHDPFLAGTWAGDILVNSADAQTDSMEELFAVMLHEIGHVLGLEENLDPQSALYSQADPSRSQLSPDDVAAIRSLYGPRTDRNEGLLGNNTLLTAKSIKFPGEEDRFDGSVPLVAFGDLSTNSDQDFFKVKSLKGYQGPMTIRVQTAGISLLEPRLTVFDSTGRILGQAESTNLLGDVLTVRLNSVRPDKSYYVKVGSASGDEFGAGRYGVSVTFDPRLAISPDQIDGILRGTIELPSAPAVDAVLEESSTELDEISPFLGAIELKTRSGLTEHSHYATSGKLTSAAGSDFYRIETPEQESDGPAVLTAVVDALSNDEAGPRLEVFDSRGNPIRMEQLVHAGGTFTIQSPDLLPGATYFLKVSGSDHDAAWKGKYRLTADFRQPTSLIRTFSSSTLSVATPQVTDTLHVARTELFQFALTADAPDGAAVGAAVQMSIVDQNGVIVFERTATAGDEPGGSSVLLSPGTYAVRFTALDLSGSTTAVPEYPLTYAVHGFALSDPIGPRIENPNSQPSTSGPPYVFRGGLVSTDPFIWINHVY